MVIRDISRQSQTIPEEHPNPKDHLRMLARGLNPLIKWQALHPIDIPTTISSTYTMVDSDSLILCKGDNPITVFLLTAAGREGRELTVKKIDAGATPIVIDGKDSETIDGATTQTLTAQYSFMSVKSDNTNWWAVAQRADVGSGAGGFTAASTTEQLTGTDSSRGSTPDSVAALWEKGSDITSSGTISIGEGGYFDVTGTTTITDIDFGTDKSGRHVMLQFDDALILTHSSTLILPGARNFTTAAGDVLGFASEGAADTVRCTFIQRAASPCGSQLLAEATPTGTGVVTFSSIPATYNHLQLIISGRSTAGVSPGVSVLVTLNNDTGSNYDNHSVAVQNVTVGQNSAAAGTSLDCFLIPHSGATASNSGMGEVLLANYADTNLFKHAMYRGQTIGATTVGTTWFTRQGGGMWRSANAINRVDITLQAGNWDTGSKVSLYGLI